MSCWPKHLKHTHSYNPLITELQNNAFFPVVHTHTAGFPVDMSLLVIGQKLQTHAPSSESACS